jgi:hypothetical protein
MSEKSSAPVTMMVELQYDPSDYGKDGIYMTPVDQKLDNYIGNLVDVKFEYEDYPGGLILDLDNLAVFFENWEEVVEEAKENRESGPYEINRDIFMMFIGLHYIQ